jgi:hypothetical protein
LGREVRNAVACKYYGIEESVMTKIADWQEEYGEPLAHSIIELRLDETHFDVAVESGTKPQVKDGSTGGPIQGHNGVERTCSWSSCA